MMLYTPSLIQTILSVSELHRFNPKGSRTVTAGGEFRPALKTDIYLANSIPWMHTLVKRIILWYAY